MWQDVVDLSGFYTSSLGHTAQRIIRRRIRDWWSNVQGDSILGMGYATPYLRPFRDDARRVIALMPGRMGVMAWPPEGPNSAGICQEDHLPLPDLSMDRILLVHGLECSNQVRAYLRESWRVLADGGHMIVAVPNRRGIWARMDHTPFGHGQPYSIDQLHHVLRESMFLPERSTRVLFVPPSRRRFLMAAASAWENVGSRWFQPLAGVVLVEATKQIYAGTTVTSPARRVGKTVAAVSSRRQATGRSVTRHGA